MIRSRIRSSLQVIVPWLLFFVVDIIKKPNQNLTDVFFLWYYLPGYLIWILITIPAYKVFNWSGKYTLLKRGAFLVVFGTVLGTFKVMLNRFIFLGSGVLFDKITVSFTPAELIGNSFYWMEATIISWVMLIIFYVIEISRKYQEKSVETSRLEADLVQANLQALKMQIRPHFLFNAHNAIATLMRSEKNEEALEMLLKLSELLRVSLNNLDHQFITLEKEISFVKKYLDIEMIRFEDRMSVVFEVDEADLNLQVPVFILQPLIENGIVHGISKTLGPSEIKISVSREQDYLQIVVFNSGTLNLNGRKGIGLSNVRSRLQTLFKDDASLSLENTESGVEAILNLPYVEKKEKEYADIDH